MFAGGPKIIVTPLTVTTGDVRDSIVVGAQVVSHVAALRHRHTTLMHCSVLYVWAECAYFNVFYNVNEFYVFQQERLNCLNKLPVENCRYINVSKFCECHFCLFTPRLKYRVG